GGEQFAERAFFFTLRGGPVQAILLAGFADEALGIDAVAIAAVFRSIVILRVDISKAGLNRVEFVVTNAPREDFLSAGRGVERPRAVLVACERDRKRVIVIANHEDCLIVSFHRDLVLRVVRSDKTRAHGVVGDFVTRRDDVFALSTKYDQ